MSPPLALLASTLLGCDGAADDSAGPTSACDCGDADNLDFTVREAGGFDDWTGAALAWAVDDSAGHVLVVAMDYESGVPRIDLEPACEDPDALVGSWVAAVPPSQAAAAERYPLLGAALTTDAGIRSLSANLGALLLSGDLQSTTPDTLRVATLGTVTLLRGEGQDGLQGALEFGARADAVGGDAEVDCDGAVRLAALDLEWASTGGD